LFLIAGVSYYAPYGIGNSDLTFDSVARDADGNIYGVVNKTGFMYVYKMDQNGTPVDYYICKREGDEAESILCYSSGALYLGQIWFEEGIENFSVWKKSDDASSFTKVWTEGVEYDMEITNLYVEAPKMYMIGYDVDENDVLVYSKSDDIDDRKLDTIETDFIPVSVKWGNDGLFILTMDNVIYYSDLSSGNMKDIGIEDAVILLTDDRGYYYRQREKEELIYTFYNGLGAYSYKDLGDIWDIANSEKASNNVILSYVDGRDRLLIVSQDGNDVKYVDDFKIGFGKYINKCIIPFLIVTCAYIVAIIIVYIFKKIIWDKKQLKYQIIALQTVTSIAWLVLMMVIFKMYTYSYQIIYRLEYAITCSDVQEGRMLAEVDIENLNYEDFLDSQQRQKIEQIFGNNTNGSSWQQNYVRQELIYGNSNPEFLFSDVAAYGRHIDTYYDKDTINAIYECISTGEGASFTDTISCRQYVFMLNQIETDENGTPFILIVRIPLDLGDDILGNMTSFYVVSIVGWIIMMLLLWFFMNRKWNFMDSVVVQMEKASRGDYKIEKKKVPNNEFGSMWTSLERMCKNVQIQKYKQIDTLDYVNQFAPKNFERLFGKERLQDIEVGETIQIPATMGIISIVDRDTLLTGKLQAKYVQYVNQLMEILFSQELSDKAIFIQNGSNLENMKVIFKEDGNSTVTAVRYSIDCIETLLGLTKSQYDTKPFILLHTSVFSCGVAGGSRQVYPFVISLEMETLGMYIEPLKNCGVRMAVTVGVYDKISDLVKSRYIGYVVSKDSKEKYDLYEILDVCSQTQELGRLKNKENFEKALKYFYANDLYVARNMFSEIVKECPDDGISRWYVFACDEMFNRQGNGNSNYGLFSGQV
jgi:hypothetical protein